MTLDPNAEATTVSAAAPARVLISVNNHKVPIAPGDRTVAEIKAAGKVPPADDLIQIIAGQMHPLADDGTVKIHGGEVFVSHPKSGGAS